MKINTIFTIKDKYDFSGPYRRLGRGGNVAQITYPDGQINYVNKSAFSAQNADMLENVNAPGLTDIISVSRMRPFIINDGYVLLQDALTYARQDGELRYRQAKEAAQLAAYDLKLQGEMPILVENAVRSILYGDVKIYTALELFNEYSFQYPSAKVVLDNPVVNDTIRFYGSLPIIFKFLQIFLFALRLINFFTKISIFFT